MEQGKKKEHDWRKPKKKGINYLLGESLGRNCFHREGKDSSGREEYYRV